MKYFLFSLCGSSANLGEVTEDKDRSSRSVS